MSVNLTSIKRFSNPFYLLLFIASWVTSIVLYDRTDYLLPYASILISQLFLYIALVSYLEVIVNEERLTGLRPLVTVKCPACFSYGISPRLSRVKKCQICEVLSQRKLHGWFLLVTTLLTIAFIVLLYIFVRRLGYLNTIFPMMILLNMALLILEKNWPTAPRNQS
jgi:hypothetical protein